MRQDHPHVFQQEAQQLSFAAALQHHNRQTPPQPALSISPPALTYLSSLHLSISIGGADIPLASLLCNFVRVLDCRATCSGFCTVWCSCFRQSCRPGYVGLAACGTQRSVGISHRNQNVNVAAVTLTQPVCICIWCKLHALAVKRQYSSTRLLATVKYLLAPSVSNSHSCSHSNSPSIKKLS